MGLGASVYFMRSNRNVALGRAFALSMGGLAAGAVIGGILQGARRERRPRACGTGLWREKSSLGAIVEACPLRPPRGSPTGWLRLDIVPLGGLSSPATLVSESALLGLFCSSVLLV